jgi:Uma2 family endonuclease
MATVESKLYTAEEFWEWQTKHGKEDALYELDRGVLIEMPSPGELHGVICALVAHLIWGYLFKRGRGYACGNDTGLLLARNPDTVRGPDIMVFCESKSLEDMSLKFCEDVPQLVIEVRSPQDRQSRTERRVSQYQQRGIPLVWYVDPEERTITVFRPSQFLYVLDESDEITGEDIFPDLRFRVADFFTLPGAVIRQSNPPGAQP